MTNARGVPTSVVHFAVWLLGVGWLVDTCAGGTTSDRIADAVLFDSEDEARAALIAAGINVDEYERAFVVVSL